MRVAKSDFQQLDLEAHRILRGVPLKEVTVVELPGGGPGSTLRDVMSLARPEKILAPNPLVASLFRLRFRLGRLFGWERDGAPLPASSFLHRLDEELKKKSEVTPGSKEGPFTMLYVLPHESLGEIVNRTVHAFLCSHLEETAHGYRLYWGVYVLPVSRMTPLYLFLIEPFRRWIVYPAIFRKIRREWDLKFQKGGVVAE